MRTFHNADTSISSIRAEPLILYELHLCLLWLCFLKALAFYFKHRADVRVSFTNGSWTKGAFADVFSVALQSQGQLGQRSVV